MKLIIDIPKERYNYIVQRVEDNKNEVNYLPDIVHFIANGTSLDDVKFHVEHMACKQYEHRLMLDRQEVIEILDNIGKAESEDKE